MAETALVRFDAARQALAEARSIDEVKTVRDQAEALRLYLKQSNQSLEMQNDVAEIKLRAERKGGDLFRAIQRDSGGRPENTTHAEQSLTPLQQAEQDSGVATVMRQRWELAASVPDEEFEQHVKDTKARRDELTTASVLRLAKSRQHDERRQANAELVEIVKPLHDLNPHPTIVIDPPWDFSDEGDVNQFGRARPTYHTMSLEQIMGLPVPSLAAKNAHLYLWITNRSLPKGFHLLEEWGFRYITALTWCKPSIGMGNYYRGSTEHVLFGVRGSLSLLQHNVGTWFNARRPGPHSGKPDEFYALVERCSPGPWLEMFARKTRPGWTPWGAEV